MGNADQAVVRRECLRSAVAGRESSTKRLTLIAERNGAADLAYGCAMNAATTAKSNEPSLISIKIKKIDFFNR